VGFKCKAFASGGCVTHGCATKGQKRRVTRVKRVSVYARAKNTGCKFIQGLSKTLKTPETLRRERDRTGSDKIAPLPNFNNLVIAFGNTTARQHAEENAIPVSLVFRLSQVRGPAELDCRDQAIIPGHEHGS
jgi:hypothetical protein